MRAPARKYRRTAVAMGFLAPNILGFLAFTLIPLVFSLAMAFSNWDLRLHNRFRSAPLQFVGLANFRRLFTEPDFWRFLGNTLFLMMGIPFSIAGSLILATLLSRDLRGGRRRVFIGVLVSAVFISTFTLVVVLGMKTTGTFTLVSGLGCAILLMGIVGGSTVYRTFYYLPHFTSGVATILLWKNLFNPNVGPINQGLAPILNALTSTIRALPAAPVQGVLWVCVAVAAVLIMGGLRRLRQLWSDGDMGALSALVGAVILLLPVALAWRTIPISASLALSIAAALSFLYHFARMFRGREFHCSATAAIGSAQMLGLALLVAECILLGLALVFWRLPTMAAHGLTPPAWHTDYNWAKPAIMIISFWAAIGSNNMLLYLAGISGVPAELYEAANIDGASSFQRFWHVTWPQLAPTTFFIVVMSVIGGLQGGFEMARTMTLGGPDGATTTLSYFIYTEGFETGRLGYSSAVAWTLFLMVLLVTLFNWKFGSRYVND